MQISRHWRLNAQRYRLQGVRYENGEVSLQSRPQPSLDAEARDARHPAAKTQAALSTGR